MLIGGEIVIIMELNEIKNIFITCPETAGAFVLAQVRRQNKNVDTIRETKMMAAMQ